MPQGEQIGHRLPDVGRRCHDKPTLSKVAHVEHARRDELLRLELLGRGEPLERPRRRLVLVLLLAPGQAWGEGLGLG